MRTRDWGIECTRLEGTELEQRGLETRDCGLGCQTGLLEWTVGVSCLNFGILDHECWNVGVSERLTIGLFERTVPPLHDWNAGPLDC